MKSTKVANKSKSKNNTDANTDKRANSLSNLKKPWEKGISGNLKGRPEGTKNKSTILREALQAMKVQDNNGKPIEDPLAYFAFRMVEIVEATNPNPAVQIQALKALTDRFIGPIEKTIRLGRTPDEIALASKQLVGDLDDIEEVDYSETNDE